MAIYSERLISLNRQKNGVLNRLLDEGYMVTDHKNDEKPGRENHKSYHMGLLAKDYEGYKNLSKVVSDAHVDGFYYRPRTDLETLEHAKGLLPLLVAWDGCPKFFTERRRSRKSDGADD